MYSNQSINNFKGCLIALKINVFHEIALLKIIINVDIYIHEKSWKINEIIIKNKWWIVKISKNDIETKCIIKVTKMMTIVKK